MNIVAKAAFNPIKTACMLCEGLNSAVVDIKTTNEAKLL
jgi:hypothetical protein